MLKYEAMGPHEAPMIFPIPEFNEMNNDIYQAKMVGFAHNFVFFMVGQSWLELHRFIFFNNTLLLIGELN